MKQLISLIFAMCVAATAQAQTTIADHLTSSGRAAIVLPAALNARLMPVAAAEAPVQQKETVATGGYRIQMYSGNNARTSKSEAEGRAAMVRDNFADIATYVIYDAPYWRLRAGDFTTYEEAAAALGDLKRAFPSFAREMRLVRDRINAR